jgi:hypothetical protein
VGRNWHFPTILAHVILRRELRNIQWFNNSCNKDPKSRLTRDKQQDLIRFNSLTDLFLICSRDIGFDRSAGGASTNIYTVITESNGDLVTMHPGLPAGASPPP